jgi:LysM repeat protein
MNAIAIETRPTARVSHLHAVPSHHRAAGTSAAPAPTGKLHLTTRGRRVIVALIVIPIILAAFFAALNGGQAGAADVSISDSSTYVTVGAGESLWAIAERIAPHSDPRDVIDAITSYNHLEGDVQAGQRIAIPAQYK